MNVGQATWTTVSRGKDAKLPLPAFATRRPKSGRLHEGDQRFAEGLSYSFYETY